MYEKVCKFSSYLKKLNLQKGDRVAAYVPNKIESIICFLACAKNIVLLPDWVVVINKLDKSLITLIPII